MRNVYNTRHLRLHHINDSCLVYYSWLDLWTCNFVWIWRLWQWIIKWNFETVTFTGLHYYKQYSALVRVTGQGVRQWQFSMYDVFHLICLALGVGAVESSAWDSHNESMGQEPRNLAVFPNCNKIGANYTLPHWQTIHSFILLD